ncbi:NADH-quinone oxidoreductase subunit N 1 [Dioscorea cayenensis subsp. rotundata]|uniref:NADH-quinone oxidoreductase subunit N 1 n=1 Tax=Dioscorea cayennensis subsp. rotundata TaxID=55577 RepID=A0AB40ATU7_DIOCR|nr:NADH-quinone oxidoreductase subunit N 1 [Dioscorea cayenensis subsp. rotundata]
MWAPDIYEGSPTPVTAFLSIAPKISISANMSRVSIVGSYGGTWQQIFFFCSIASMILGALAAMAQTKVKRPLAHSSIGHVGYIRTGFSCGTIEGIQSLLIGIFIYASMTIDAFTAKRRNDAGHFLGEARLRWRVKKPPSGGISMPRLDRSHDQRIRYRALKRQFDRLYKFDTRMNCSAPSKMHAVRWELVCRPKTEGGLEIRSLKDWNTASQARLFWEVASGKNDLRG